MSNFPPLPPLPPLPPMPGKGNNGNVPQPVNPTPEPAPQAFPEQPVFTQPSVREQTPKDVNEPVPPVQPQPEQWQNVPQQNQPPVQQHNAYAAQQVYNQQVPPQPEQYGYPTQNQPKLANKTGKLFLWGGIGLGVGALVGVIAFIIPAVLGGFTGATNNTPNTEGTATGQPNDPANTFIINEITLADGKTLTVEGGSKDYWVNVSPIRGDQDEYGASSFSTNTIKNSVEDEVCAQQSIIFENSEPVSTELIDATLTGFTGKTMTPETTVKPLSLTDTQTQGYYYTGFEYEDYHAGIGTAVTFPDQPNVVVYNFFYCSDQESLDVLTMDQFDTTSPYAVYYNIK